MTGEPSGLTELTALVRDCSVAGVARRVLLVRTDLLPPSLSRPHHLRLAREALDPLLTADRARHHALPEGRIAISWRGEAVGRLQQALDSLGYLLLDAPLEAPAMPDLARVFELPADGAALLALASTGRFPAQPGTAPAGAPPAAAVIRGPPPVPPLDLATVEAIEARLSTASVARFARRRMACRLGDHAFAPAWENRFLAVRELVGEIAPRTDPFAEPWLFRRLTRSFDRRMLALLSAPAELRDAGPFSLDLNVGGLLAPEFLRFDTALPARLRGQTVLNLHPADIMSDLPGFRFASAFARARGHRILLRGITTPLLPLLDFAALELDYIELRWSPTLAGLDPGRLRGGSARWLLSRADGPDAVQWGRSAGIGLFQGDAVRPGTSLVPLRSAA